MGKYSYNVCTFVEFINTAFKIYIKRAQSVMEIYKIIWLKLTDGSFNTKRNLTATTVLLMDAAEGLFANTDVYKQLW